MFHYMIFTSILYDNSSSISNESADILSCFPKSDILRSFLEDDGGLVLVLVVTSCQHDTTSKNNNHS